MKRLFVIPLVLAVIVGCAKEEPAAQGDGPQSTAQGKPGEMKGMSASQVGVTNAGANADKMTGSKAGGGQ